MSTKCPKCHSDNTLDSTFCSSCGLLLNSIDKIPVFPTKTIEIPIEKLSTGTTFAGRYQIIEELGQGGMGKVYKVKDTILDEEMALKLLRTEIVSDNEIIIRFRNELKLARKITHKNVCRVFDFHEEGDIPFITMEYVPGVDLRSLILKQGKLPIQEALQFVFQVAEGLAEAHKLGVIHRDLKPQNIIIDEAGSAKILDFGIARSVELPGSTQTGFMIGTPDYISPEQAGGETADQRSDIYSLGVILYEMVTGKRPFKGDTALSLALKHREEIPADPRSINPDISKELSHLILTCMEKDRVNRPADAQAFLNSLQNLMEGISMKTYIQRPSQRKKNLVPAVVILGLLAAVFIIIKVLDKGPITHYISDRPSLAVLYFENNTGDASLAHWRHGFADLISTDLSQSRYLNILSGDRVFKILNDLGQLEATKYSADVLKQVAQKGKVRHILLGSYIKAGPKFRVSISIQDMDTGELVGSQIAEAENEESLFSLVDDLTQKIKSDLQLTTKQIANDFDKEAADILTSSPEAYKLFVEGLRHLYGGEYQLCIEFMDNAIAIDPEFVSAIGWKAFSYDSMGYHQEFVTAMTKAFELRNTVSERERIKFTAYYYMRVSNDIPKAKEELERWASFYPEDKWANHQLGFLYYHAFEDYEKATEYLQNNIENRIEMFYSYYVMASAEMCLGNYDKAQDICELYISEIGDHPDMRFNLAINYFCRGNYDQAFTEAEKAAELGFAGTSWNDLIKGGILQAKGDIEGAKWYYQNMVDSRDALVGVMGREQLGELALFQGRFEEATSQIVQALNLAEATGNEASLTRLYNFLAYTYFQMGDYYKGLEACRKALDYGEKSMDPINGIKLALHLKGLSQLALGTSEAALKTVEELKILAEKGPSLSSMKDYFHLTASIEMNEGNFSEAKAHFEKAASLLPSQNQDDLFGYKESLRRTFYLTSLAESYLRAGNMDKALQAYEFLTNLTIGRHHWSDLHAKAFYWLGKIYEQQGDTAKAIEHYKKFLDLWKDADPGLPEVDDAKKRLDGLR